MEFYEKIVDGFHLLIIFAKNSILDIRMGFENASEQRTFIECLFLI